MPHKIEFTGSETTPKSSNPFLPTIRSTTTSKSRPLSLPLIGTETTSKSRLLTLPTKCFNLILEIYHENVMLTSDHVLPNLSCHPECPRGSTIHLHLVGNKIVVDGIGSLQSLFVNKAFYNKLSSLVYSRMELFCGLSESGPPQLPPNPFHIPTQELLGTLEKIPNLQRYVRHVQFTVPLLYTLYHFMMWEYIGRDLGRGKIIPHNHLMCSGVSEFALYFGMFAKLDQLKVVVEHAGVGKGKGGAGMEPYLDWLLPLWNMSSVTMNRASLHFLCSLDDRRNIAKNKLRQAWRMCQEREEKWPALKLGLSAFTTTKLSFKDRWSWLQILQAKKT